jgi:hypothetical protein
MNERNKIFLDRSEGLEAAVDKIIHSRATDVVLNIPKGSSLGLSVNNFHVLKREGATAGKKLTIESVDDHVLELASQAKITASNPIFRSKEKPSLDIVRRTAPASKTAKTRAKDVEVEVDEEIREVPLYTKVPREAQESIVYEEDEPRESRLPRILITWGIIACVGIGGWVALTMLPRATVNLELVTVDKPISEKIQVGKDYSDVASVGSIIQVPGELITERGTLSMDFPTNGKETVNQKATGKLTIFNAYSSSPQQLVAQTRFESPNGTIFRLDKAVTVPPAKIENGKIQASSIEVTVSANEPGEAYNIPPATQWKIPGFKGTPRYAGFYADSYSAMSGGVVGERAVPSADDRAQGEQKVEEALFANLQAKIKVMANDNKAIEGSTSFVITKKEVQFGAQDEGKFTVYMEGEIKQIVFNEQKLKDVIVSNIRTAESIDDKVDQINLTYGVPEFDFKNGLFDVDVTGTVRFVANIQLEDIKTSLYGANDAAARAVIKRIVGLKGGSIEFWPFWVRSVPTNPQYVQFNIK